jgi:photosystem II stability/assembly factor-like uncharacterized protein
MKKITIILTVLIVMTITTNAQWVQQNSATSEWINSIYFTDSNNGYAVGDYGVIRKTTNGGENWATQTGTLNDFLSVYFTDMNTGYIVGYSGTILKTTNGGTNWTQQISGYNNILRSVFFTDANTGYAVGDTGLILKTTNGGTEWIKLTSGTQFHLQCVYFSASNKGYIVGGNGVGNGIIMKTTDGGENWTTYITGLNNYYKSIYSHESNSGCAVGINGKIVKASVDDPGVWTEQTSGVSVDLNGISFYQNIGYAVGDEGVIIKTIDYGNTWTTQVSGTSIDLLSVCLTSSTTAYVSGVNGTILKTTNGGITGISSLNNAKNNIHIFPNPATEVISITLENVEYPDLTLIIYNAIGESVKSEKLIPNQQQINVGDLSNGVYIVEIKSKEWTGKQKMIIQR